MSTSRTGHVLVATSGSAASRSAIAFAARAAEARGLALEVVHVVTPTVAAGPYGASLADTAVRQAGRALLTDGEALAHSVEPGLEVTTTLLIGSRPDAIVDKARHAALVVVGGPPRDLLGRLWTGSTVTGVAARAACPVAVVPAGQPETTSHEVLVGLKSTEHVDQLLSTAFAIANQTGSALRIVHAWQLLSPYDNAVAERLPVPAWETEVGEEIEALLIDLRLAYPNVPVRVDLVHGQAGYALVEASREADLLVISRPAHGGFFHHLGAAARAVLREAHCPVIVVPPGETSVAIPYGGANVAATP